MSNVVINVSPKPIRAATAFAGKTERGPVILSLFLFLAALFSQITRIKSSVAVSLWKQYSQMAYILTLM